MICSHPYLFSEYSWSHESKNESHQVLSLRRRGFTWGFHLYLDSAVRFLVVHREPFLDQEEIPAARLQVLHQDVLEQPRRRQTWQRHTDRFILTDIAAGAARGPTRSVPLLSCHTRIFSTLPRPVSEAMWKMSRLFRVNAPMLSRCLCPLRLSLPWRLMPTWAVVPGEGRNTARQQLVTQRGNTLMRNIHMTVCW